MHKTIQAQVRSIQRIATPQGQRFFAVFQTPSQREVAIWSPDLGQFDAIEVGSTVELRETARGQVTLDLTALPQSRSPISEDTAWFSQLLGSFL